MQQNCIENIGGRFYGEFTLKYSLSVSANVRWVLEIAWLHRFTVVRVCSPGRIVEQCRHPTVQGIVEVCRDVVLFEPVLDRAFDDQIGHMRAVTDQTYLKLSMYFAVTPGEKRCPRVALDNWLSPRPTTATAGGFGR